MDHRSKMLDSAGTPQNSLANNRTVISLFGSELQDACFMLTPTPRIHCKW